MVEFEISENIKLKMLRIEDASILFSLIDSNRDYLKKWLSWLDINKSASDSEEYIKSTQRQYKNELGFMCGIYNDSTLVGMCGFHPIDKANHSVTIGYWISESTQGLGIVTSCVNFLLKYAFETLNLNKVLIPAAEKNFRSQAVSKRLGLTNEGIDREAEFLYTHYVNHVRYTMLRREWLDR